MKSIATSLLQAAFAATVLLESTTSSVHAAPLVARADNNDDVSNPFPASKSIRLPIAQRKWRTARNELEKRQESGSDGTLAEDNISELLNWQDARYIATVDVAGQELDLILDTGSSDTWVYSSQPRRWQNIDPSLLPPLFDNTSAVGVDDTGLIYLSRYGAGDGILETHGRIQTTDVSLIGTDLNVTDQVFASIYDATSGIGASGLMGFGFPLGSSIWATVINAYARQNRQYMTLDQSSQYWPIVLRLAEQGEVSRPMFSMEFDGLSNTSAPVQSNSFDYTSDMGLLTIGDYPDGYTEESFTWSPVPYVTFSDEYVEAGFPVATGNRWTTPLEAIYFNGARIADTQLQPNYTSDGQRLFALVDSGGPTMLFPADTMAAITNAWAANPSNEVMDCSAPFELIFQFSGQNFTMAKDEMVVPYYNVIDSIAAGGRPTSGCQFQAQVDSPSGDEFGPLTSITYSLGDPFMRNVVTTFDYGNVRDATQNPPRMGFATKR